MSRITLKSFTSGSSHTSYLLRRARSNRMYRGPEGFENYALQAFLWKIHARCILKIPMRKRLLAATLSQVLFCINLFVNSMCAAYCMATAGSATAHHQMGPEPNPSNIDPRIHIHHHPANCTDCPPDRRSSLNQKADCTGLVQIQALREGSFSLGVPSGVTYVHVVDMPGRAPGLAPGGERFSSIEAPNRIRPSSTVSAPLRI